MRSPGDCGIKKALGISSPSKEAARVGEWFGEGAVIGMQRAEGAIAAESHRLSDLMELEPTPYGTYAVPGAYQGQQTQQMRQFIWNVQINVTARSEDEAVAYGKGISESLYAEFARRERQFDAQR